MIKSELAREEVLLVSWIGEGERARERISNKFD